MEHPGRRKLRLVFYCAGLGILGLLIFALIATVLTDRRASPAQVRRLPDGSTLSLQQTAFTNSYSYSYKGMPRFLEGLAPILPSWIQRRFAMAGSFGFGTDGNSNLFLITLNRMSGNKGASSLLRLQVADEESNTFDACWGANTLGMQGQTIHGWQLRAFPRRSKNLIVRFPVTQLDQSWGEGAEFRIPNPAYGTYPQWTGEPWPITKVVGNLGVTLAQFESGLGGYGIGDPLAVPRKTRLRFTFEENHKVSDDWRIQKITISDATGNRWFPYLDLNNQGLNWARDGTVEFLGALWPGEQAWKLEVEVARKSGFTTEELWEVPLVLPAAGKITKLQQTRSQPDINVALIALASPETDHSAAFQWTGKWWGNDKKRVYSLVLKMDTTLEGAAVHVIKAIDQNDETVKLMEHRGQEYAEQAIFLKPETNATHVRLTLALQRSRRLHFLARPEFAKSDL